MDNEDKTIIPDETVEETAPTPSAPKTTVGDFLFGLGGIVSDLRKTYRLSEGAAMKLLQFGLEYDLSRRHMSREESIGNEAGV